MGNKAWKLTPLTTEQANTYNETTTIRFGTQDELATMPTSSTPSALFYKFSKSVDSLGV
jgi:hypothetical protein